LRLIPKHHQSARLAATVSMVLVEKADSALRVNVAHSRLFNVCLGRQIYDLTLQPILNSPMSRRKVSSLFLALVVNQTGRSPPISRIGSTISTNGQSCDLHSQSIRNTTSRGRLCLLATERTPSPSFYGFVPDGRIWIPIDSEAS
jgi:hypothetical protein